MNIFDALGFSWDRQTIQPPEPLGRDVALYRYQKMMAQHIYDASILEGNPFTFPEIQTLMEGITVGGHKLSDQQQVLNLERSTRHLIKQVQNNEFRLEKGVSDHLHYLVAENEALEWGRFRGEGEIQTTPMVSLGDETFYPSHATVPGAGNLTSLFFHATSALEMEVLDHRERAMAYFLFGALQQFYFDGNKRTARLMMNGVLLQNGLDAISIPAQEKLPFNEKMVRFYKTREATEMMQFLVNCQTRISTKINEHPGLTGP